MDFLDNNKDLPTHGMKRKTKMENQRGFSGCFVNLQTKLKKLFLLTTPKLFSGNQGKFTESKKTAHSFFQSRSRSSNNNSSVSVPSLFYSPFCFFSFLSSTPLPLS